MSQADIQKFKTEISSDTKGFQTQLEKEINGLKGNFPTQKDRTFQALINLGSRRGYHFTKEELTKAAADTELSDADLELVAGGGS